MSLFYQLSITHKVFTEVCSQLIDLTKMGAKLNWELRWRVFFFSVTRDVAAWLSVQHVSANH